MDRNSTKNNVGVVGCYVDLDKCTGPVRARRRSGELVRRTVVHGMFVFAKGGKEETPNKSNSS